jgi:fimbrial chaperone protein
MFGFRTRTRAASMAALALTFCIAGLASAAQFSIGITRIHLDASNPVETVGLTNQEAREVTFEVHVKRWRQNADGTWDLADTDALIVHPLIVRLPKEGMARVRVGSLSPSVSAEEAYRIELNELPDRTPAAAGQVRMLTNVSVPVFVEPANAKPALAMSVASVEAKGIDLALKNAGTAYAAPGQATLRILDAKGRKLGESQVTTVYVLAGAQAHLRAELPASTCADAARVELAIGDAAPLLASIAPDVRRCAR